VLWIVPHGLPVDDRPRPVAVENVNDDLMSDVEQRRCGRASEIVVGTAPKRAHAARSARSFSVSSSAD
jgi:hypothetical protein